MIVVFGSVPSFNVNKVPINKNKLNIKRVTVLRFSLNTMIVIHSILVSYLLIAFGINGSDGEVNCGCALNRRNGVLESKYPSFLTYLNEFSEQRQCKDSLVKNSKAVSNDVDMVLMEEGRYRIGTDIQVLKADKEGPARLVSLKSFYFDKYEVSNYKFRQFVEATGYITEAEKFGNSFVFQYFLNDSVKAHLKDYRVASALWWYRVEGANWRYPEGPDSNIEERLDHPVVHVSWNDAEAYCKWAHKRLPTEEEWEAACRSSHPYRIYPWGDELMLNNKHWTNIWQGVFPTINTASDGYIGTNPVHEFVQNELGLCNMAGNVWEWTQNYWDNPLTTERVKKGGSYLCHKKYCFRYRCSARSQNTQDSSAHNLGFRCAKNAIS